MAKQKGETMAQRNAKIKKLISATEKTKAQAEKIEQWEEKNLKSGNHVGRKVAHECNLLLKALDRIKS